MTLDMRLQVLADLGQKIDELSTEALDELAFRANGQNPWFTPPNVKLAFAGIRHLLEPNELAKWAAKYTFGPQKPQTVGIVMAGNLPMVGAHDLFCVFLSGHRLQAKLSSQDTFLMTRLVDWLIELAPEWRASVQLTERLVQIDAVVATGSDNSSRYFDYYFAKYPHIIRKNRTSVAVLSGGESVAQLQALGQDVFQYFGLGCRNVSKLLVPPQYNFAHFYEAIEPLARTVGDYYKYQNNHDYNLSIYLVNGTPHLDNGFLILKEDKALVSPISVLFYEYYTDEADLAQKLTDHADKIQCVVADPNTFPNYTAFGQTQQPSIADYADGIDTLQFLLAL